MTDAILHTKDLAIGYRHKRGSVQVAENLIVSLQPGECVCLLGPNGAGKSTLIRTLAGMQKPLAGKALIDGENIHRMDARDLARRLSVVLTEKVAAGALSVYGLVALGRHPYTNWSGRLKEHDVEKVRWAMEAVGVTPLAARNASELSDGERQKVMIARALCQDPQVMILDEPTAFLDLPRRVEVMRLLQKLARREGRSILLSTHDLDLALKSADRIWLLPAEGEMVAGGPEDLVLSGAFEKVFHTEGVSFDKATGGFHIRKKPVGTAMVTGDPEAVNWTERALQRKGFVIDETDPLVTVEANLKEGVVSWKLTIKEKTTEGETLLALAGELKGFASS